MSPWMVDSKGSNHMSENINIFHKYSPCHENFTTKIVDGSLSKVAGIGSRFCSPSLDFDLRFCSLGSKFGL